MSSGIVTTGLSKRKFKSVLTAALKRAKPSALGVAVAYVSKAGFDYLNQLVDQIGIEDCHLVTDTKDAVTHPKALAAALAEGWETRVVDTLPGTFHPKLYFGGRA